MGAGVEEPGTGNIDIPPRGFTVVLLINVGFQHFLI